jgi:hypothetical protein
MLLKSPFDQWFIFLRRADFPSPTLTDKHRKNYYLWDELTEYRWRACEW